MEGFFTTAGGGTGCVNISKGKLIMSGDQRSKIQRYINTGRMIAYSGHPRAVVSYDFNYSNSGKTTVWADAPGIAILPEPANFSTNYGQLTSLTWVAGIGLNSHDVYFGDNFADVNNATNALPIGTSVYKGSTSTASYTLTDFLPMGRTYYWRVDEVNDADPQSPYKGTMWSFKQMYCGGRAPSLDDFWTGNAKWQLDCIAIGLSFNFHFPCLLWQGNEIWGYYIKHATLPDGRDDNAIGLARSRDGVNWTDDGYVLHIGNSGSWDDRIASFPGVYVENGTYYMVYEGAGFSGSYPGDIGLATSTDGRHFTKSTANPILRHNTSGWERLNIGTPSLTKFGNTWRMYYHGYGGDCQDGLAMGTNLFGLTKYSGNPIIPTVEGTWESGTIGRRSTLIQTSSGYYYCAYEGSTNAPYETANWSSGIARSTDAITWQKYPNNPVIPVSVGTFGNDGPELIIINGKTYMYVRAHGGSDRYCLVWNTDVDFNDCINLFDTAEIGKNWQQSSSYGDINGDGVINLLDIRAIAATWLSTQN
jgi:predicted GH43/DUF377 family glycosyl hydrolase